MPARSDAYFSTLIAMMSLALFSCSHAGSSQFNANDRADRGVAYGFFKVVLNGTNMTSDSTVVFTDGQAYKLDSGGFIAAHLPIGRAGLTQIILSSGAIYKVTNLEFRSGADGTKTYIGHIVFTITSPPATSSDADERWTWVVTNHFKQAWAYWNKYFGADNRKPYYSLAVKTGPDRSQARSIATDRSDVVPGF